MPFSKRSTQYVIPCIENDKIQQAWFNRASEQGECQNFQNFQIMFSVKL